MLKLTPIKSEKIWGYELWIASTHPNGPQSEFVKACGGEYPLLVKIIQANDTLSIQVHPDDEDAVRLEGPGNRGKTECWYVLDAAPGAKLVYGLKDGASREQLADAIQPSYLRQACAEYVPGYAGGGWGCEGRRGEGIGVFASVGMQKNNIEQGGCAGNDMISATVF